VHRLIDVRALLEAALTHHAALRITNDEVHALRTIVDQAAAATNWADYRLADELFHRGVAQASGLEWALPYYDEVLTDLYAYFLPYPIEHLHEANKQHAALVDALDAHDPARSVDIIETHVCGLHETMFVGLRVRAPSPPATTG
jgi:GntR family transcriptional regulator, transcriptional repressor for pyruvate dehydrogenase complex